MSLLFIRLAINKESKNEEKSHNEHIKSTVEPIPSVKGLDGTTSEEKLNPVSLQPPNHYEEKMYCPSARMCQGDISEF